MKKLLTVFFCAITLCTMASELKPTAKVESGVFTYITFPSGPGTKTGWMCLDSGFLRVSNMQIASLGTDTLIVMYGRDSAFAVLGLSAFRTLLNSGYLLLSDTASMLANRLKISDTLTMLSNRLKISDTVAMLSGYQRTGSGGGTISSVIGTANQITAITSGGAVSLTLSTGIILSGSLSTTGIITAGSLSIGGTSTSNIGGTTTMNTVSITNGLNASSITGIGGSALISGFNSIGAITLNGTIGTAAQPNITSLGTLSILTVNGVVAATTFSGSGANLTNIPNSALTNSSITIGSTNIALGATATSIAGLTALTSQFITATKSYDLSTVGATDQAGRFLYDASNGYSMRGIAGSVNDWIIKNAAGSTIATVPTTTTNINFTGIINAAGITVTGAVQANSFSGTLITLAPASSQAGLDMRNGSTVLQLYPNSVIISPISPSFKTTVSLDNLTTGAGVGVAGIKNKINIDTNRVIITNTSASGVSHSQTIFTNGAMLADISNTFPTVAGELATGVKYTADGTNVTTQQSGAGFSTTGTITASNLAGTLTTATQPNITSLGTLTNLTVTGFINAASWNNDLFVNGGSVVIPNQQFYYSRNTSGTLRSMLRIDGSDNVVLGNNGPSITIAPTTQVATFVADAKLSTVGSGIYVKEGSNATMGTGTLSGGTVVISTTKVTANSRIFITDNGGGIVANIGALYISARTAGTSFTVSSSNALDTSNFSWIIIEPS